jgi:hypothetical protein
MTATKRGGKRQNSGNKAKDGATMATTKQICARIWIRQGAVYKALGGSEWLRATIDRETQHNAGGEATGAALCDRSPRP